MYYVEYKYDFDETFRYEGLTREQANSLAKQMEKVAWYVRKGEM